MIDEIRKRGACDEQIMYYSFDSLEYEDIKTAKALYLVLIFKSLFDTTRRGGDTDRRDDDQVHRDCIRQ